MESSRYWQNFGEAMERGGGDEVAGRGSARNRQLEKKKGCRAIMYGGRVMSMDVYLAVPTFMRRGITIIA